MDPSPAVAVALAHIDAWSRHDWERTRELLAPDVRASVMSTQPQFGNGSQFTGIDNYMARKTKGAQWVEPGSVQVLSTLGDETGAVVTVSLRIRLGAGSTMVTMVRACLYSIDDTGRIKEEQDIFHLLSR